MSYRRTGSSKREYVGEGEGEEEDRIDFELDREEERGRTTGKHQAATNDKRNTLGSMHDPTRVSRKMPRFLRFPLFQPPPHPPRRGRTSRSAQASSVPRNFSGPSRHSLNPSFAGITLSGLRETTGETLNN